MKIWFDRHRKKTSRDGTEARERLNEMKVTKEERISKMRVKTGKKERNKRIKDVERAIVRNVVS